MNSIKLKVSYIGKQDKISHTSKLAITIMTDGSFRFWIDDSSSTARFDLEGDNKIRLIEFLQQETK